MDCHFRDLPDFQSSEERLMTNQWQPSSLNRLRSGTARVGETLQLWGMQEAASCPCGHPTQTVEHVVTDCVLLKSPGDLTALCCPNAETRSWLSELPIELWTLIFDYLVVVWQTLIIMANPENDSPYEITHKIKSSQPNLLILVLL